MDTIRNQARLCLWLNVGGLIFLFSFIWLYYFSLRHFQWWQLGDCAIREVVGIYCPGCGGTRCIISFLEGRLFYSFSCCPALYVAGVDFILYDIFVLLSLIKKSEKPLRHISYHLITTPVWVLLGVFVLRNILALALGYDPLGDLVG